MTKTSDNLPAIVGATDEGVAIYKVGALDVPGYLDMTPAVRAWVAHVAADVASSTDEAVLAIVGSILDADTLDGILGEGSVMHSEDVVGRAFTLHGVRWAKSTFAAGLPFYALLEIGPIGGEGRSLVSCSATNVMAQAWALLSHGFLPCDVRLDVSKRPTASGYYPMRLHQVTEQDKAF